MKLKDIPMHKTNSELLEAVQLVLGYEIEASQLPQEQQAWSKGAIVPNFDSNIWSFLYNPNSCDDALICHELLHLALWIEGWPYFQNMPCVNLQQVVMINSLPQHMMISKMTLELGINPEEGDTDSILKRIEEIESGTNPELFSESQRSMNVAIILGRLISCANAEVKQQLRVVAKEKVPTELYAAESLLEQFNSLMPMTPQNCVQAHYALFDLFYIPRSLERSRRYERPIITFFSDFLNISS